MWDGTEPDLTRIHTFGSKAYLLVPPPEQTKLGPRSHQVIYLGPNEQGSHRVVFPGTRTIINSRNVTFDEKELTSYSDNDQISIDEDNEEDSSPSVSSSSQPQAPVSPNDDETIHVEDDPHLPPVPEFIVKDFERAVKAKKDKRSRPQRKHQPNKRYFNDDFVNAANEINVVVTATPSPNSYSEAINSPHSNEWKKAMDDEINALIKNNTYELVPLPEGRKPISTRWIYKVKHRADGSIKRFKARWVARGFSQQFGVDYDETFSPVVRMENLRLLLGIATALDYKIHQMDVDSAFLQAELNEDIYVTQPEGYISNDQPDHVCKLIKSLYGLKQAPLLWNRTIDEHLKQNGFLPSQADSCIYIKQDSRHLVVIALYVDDCIIICPQADLIPTKQLLTDRFKLKDMGEATSVLGIELIRNRTAGTLDLRQLGNIRSIIDTFNMQGSKPRSTPLPVGTQLEKLDATPAKHAHLPYRSLIGRLLYVAISTRPDIAHAVGLLSKHLTAYDNTHWDAAKQVLRYLHATELFSIRYSRNLANYSGPKLAAPIGYCDSDWAGTISDRKSTSGYVFLFAGGPISWISKRQSIVALSSTEAEYISLSECTKQAIYLCKLRHDLKLDTDELVKIYIDNQSAIAIATSPNYTFHARTKHIDVRLHHLRDEIKNGKIKLFYCPSTEMIADMLTKCLPAPRFEALRKLINVQPTTACE